MTETIQAIIIAKLTADVTASQKRIADLQKNIPIMTQRQNDEIAKEQANLAVVQANLVAGQALIAKAGG